MSGFERNDEMDMIGDATNALGMRPQAARRSSEVSVELGPPFCGKGGFAILRGENQMIME